MIRSRFGVAIGDERGERIGMNEGKRRPVMEQVPGMAIEDLDRALLAWVEAEIYSAVGPRRAV